MRSAMMMRAAAGSIAVLLAGCATEPPPTLYRLEADAPAQPARSAPAAEVIAVASVRVPERVDRRQIVVEDGGEHDVMSQGHRWSGPLSIQIERMLARRLESARPQAWIETERDGPAPPATARAMLIIDELGAHLGGSVVVAARWEVRDLKRNKLRLGRITVGQAASGAGYDALVEAIARAMDQVCGAVAGDLDALARD